MKWNNIETTSDRFSNSCEAFIWSWDNKEDENNPDYIQLLTDIILYLQDNADKIINQAFHISYLSFYGVDKTLVQNKQDMVSQLKFDSVVYLAKENEIGIYLTNDEFMFGHFIDTQWDLNWNLIHTYIC